MGWKEFSLNDICTDFQNGIGKNKEHYGKGTKVANIGDLYEQPTFEPLKYSLLEVNENEILKYKLEHGDILFVRSSVKREGVAYCSMYDSDELCLFSSFMIRARPNKKLIDPKFLAYQLRSPNLRVKLINAANTSTITNISQPSLKKIKIKVPEIPIQKRIADLLDKADTLRQKDRELLEQYDRLAESVFLEMFGDPVLNNKNWPKLQLSEIGQLDRGVSKNRPRNSPELLGGPYPLIQTGDVANSGGYIKDFNSTYSEKGLKQSKLWKKGTLCITIAANIAKTGILGFDACFPDSIVGFIPSSKTNTAFVQGWFSFFQKILEEGAPESAQKNINLKILRELEIIFPPIDLQSKFARIIQNIEEQKGKMFMGINQSESLFQSLLQKAFRGELFQEHVDQETVSR